MILKNKWQELVKYEDLWLQICFGSWFEVECLRNDYHRAHVVLDEIPDLQANQFILNTRKFKLVLGKHMDKKQEKYYDIPPVIMNLLNSLGPVGEPKAKYSKDWWNYNSRRIYYKHNPILNQGLNNLLRICKAKWIEDQNIPLTEKNRLHKEMQHSYDVVEKYYV